MIRAGLYVSSRRSSWSKHASEKQHFAFRRDFDPFIQILSFLQSLLRREQRTEKWFSPVICVILTLQSASQFTGLMNRCIQSHAQPCVTDISKYEKVSWSQFVTNWVTPSDTDHENHQCPGENIPARNLHWSVSACCKLLPEDADADHWASYKVTLYPMTVKWSS